jgi:hypothetical protein
VSTALLIVLIVVAVLLLLAVGGAIANSRRQHELDDQFAVDLARVNRSLAAAHAEDRGWEPVALERSARAALEQERPGSVIREVALVQVVDRPGTEDDKAVFRFETDDGRAYLKLGRRDGDWVLESLS